MPLLLLGLGTGILATLGISRTSRNVFSLLLILGGVVYLTVFLPRR